MPIPVIRSRNLDSLVTRESRIRAKFDQFGGEHHFGPRVEHHFGSLWTFRGAAIAYDSSTDAAYEMHGDIYQRWLAAGGLSFGRPCTDELATPDGIGRYNHFNGHTASIYWTPDTGACDIYGGIRARWAELGWERSYLGYPTSNESDFAEGGRANSFQHGGIYWWPDTGAIDLRDVVVHYTGLHCFGETDWDQLGSTADEPYVIFALATATAAWTTRSRVYGDVDDRETHGDFVELYRGRPYGLTIGSVVMEHDDGNPDRYRQAITDALLGVHSVGTVALTFIPAFGPAIAAAVGPLLGSLMPVLGGAINDALDLGDDQIGSSTITLTGRQLVLLAARTGNRTIDGIGYKVESPLMTGLGASYRVYVGVVPA